MTELTDLKEKQKELEQTRDKMEDRRESWGEEIDKVEDAIDDVEDTIERIQSGGTYKQMFTTCSAHIESFNSGAINFKNYYQIIKKKREPTRFEMISLKKKAKELRSHLYHVVTNIEFE